MFILFKYVFVLLNLCSTLISVKSKTIHYTIPPTIQPVEDYYNGQFTTKTYELQVPGSQSIKIIEADQPLWAQDTTFMPDINNATAKRQRKFQFGDRIHDLFTTQRIKTTLNQPIKDEDTNIRKASELQSLNKFLKEYTKQFATRNTQQNKDKGNSDQIFMEKVDLIEHPVEHEDKDRHYKGSSSYEDKRHGWVTLEAVPWSTSKVSKWESNIKQTRWPSQDQLAFATNYYEDKDRFDGRPSRPTRPQYNDVIDKYFDANKQDWAADVPSKPSWDKNYGALTSSSSWAYNFDKPSTITSNTKFHNHDKDCDHRVHTSDIITDGRPADFPTAPLSFVPYNDVGGNRPLTSDAAYSDTRPFGGNSPPRPSSGSYQRPTTYPESGNGQWVLLSTTKGYQYPKNRQRSLDINPGVLASRKSIHLTVLPALNGSDVNMTTSHGGLLQVDANSESVDDARKSYIRKMKFGTTTRRPIRGNRNKRPLATTKPTATITNGPDTTAVLAAVGAGMVPATMAMVVPMVLGRKRRSIIPNRYYVDGDDMMTAESDNFMVEKLDLSVTQLPDFLSRPRRELISAYSS